MVCVYCLFKCVGVCLNVCFGMFVVQVVVFCVVLISGMLVSFCSLLNDRLVKILFIVRLLVVMLSMVRFVQMWFMYCMLVIGYEYCVMILFLFCFVRCFIIMNICFVLIVRFIVLLMVGIVLGVLVCQFVRLLFVDIWNVLSMQQLRWLLCIIVNEFEWWKYVLLVSSVMCCLLVLISLLFFLLGVGVGFMLSRLFLLCRKIFLFGLRWLVISVGMLMLRFMYVFLGMFWVMCLVILLWVSCFMLVFLGGLGGL